MVRHGVFVAPFDELYDPRVLAELAVSAEERGWDGFFLWDHIRYRPPASAVADVWIALAAIAASTSRIALGPLVTPIARRRPHKLARETVTLDHLSRGRLILGAGLGGDRSGEFSGFGEETDERARARLLDEGLESLEEYWRGGFDPPPVQQPRIPVWIAGRWPNRRPLQRALRWDGYFPIDLPGPDALAEYAAEIDRDIELVVTDPPGSDWAAWERAGATWCLTGWDSTPRLDAVREAIEAGPP
jgi:alkanesulfonate monooxygenase SsuD/methylene tetrahydromethanopterin reductase-like flavin-dependent oxidoreductase (luciferase family)